MPPYDCDFVSRSPPNDAAPRDPMLGARWASLDHLQEPRRSGGDSQCGRGKGHSITRANVAALVLLVVWRRNDGTLQKMLFIGDAPWSCVRDGIYFFQTTMQTPLDGVTQQTIKEVFGAKGGKVAVAFMTAPHHGSTHNMDGTSNRSTRLRQRTSSFAAGTAASSIHTMADGTAVTDLLEQFDTATAYCTMAKFLRLPHASCTATVSARASYPKALACGGSWPRTVPMFPLCPPYVHPIKNSSTAHCFANVTK
jgi:hypothetical protein